jgi:alpha-D-ribose 1-methylphosphonate 5-triphosphate synthase subunit PhnH
VVEEPDRAMFAVAMLFTKSSFATACSAAAPVSAQAASASASVVMAAAVAPASVVMPGADPASTPLLQPAPQGVDGGPAAAMTNGAARLTRGGASSAVDSVPLAVSADPSAMGSTKLAQSVTPPGSSAFHLGTDEAPEASATLILQIASLTTGRRYRLEGPGLRQPAILIADGLPPDFAAIWQRNHALFPCGIDLILCAGNRLAALPRSVSVQEA